MRHKEETIVEVGLIFINGYAFLDTIFLRHYPLDKSDWCGYLFHTIKHIHRRLSKHAESSWYSF